jgi:hypothetical protein
MLFILGLCWHHKNIHLIWKYYIRMFLFGVHAIAVLLLFYTYAKKHSEENLHVILRYMTIHFLVVGMALDLCVWFV